MDSVNYTIARARLSLIMDKASADYPVEINRRGKESAVVISKTTYEKLKKLEYDLKFNFAK
ncbi:type II toxin-antitoxin system Phd/YefM family antitoxin [Acinetobacter sp. ANC 4173]|uniref:type II toxin-antitoxin system Phd/YefM family antitoxin n=1 Tax=Acinetobacter sp. ANC 4173 TaxID=2529837 RepID=UPI00103C5949|nr:type II toxin-antitoxin system prevent-host-death family antitoxin [Acinetobacter sp. ANC 4173]TCB82222.1 type II toxin-antitoxin system Phd/YefM family antitoxin [Acinetobacter sp. ANC 4173]